ncbi:MAG: ribbon-helix-helix protein, CopG family [Acidobacteria bacterium]|nr:ribbon-helix-helix protein, CopG family [Acidobacteriota bacterium]
MGNTITVRLPADLAEWLDATSRKAGVPRGRIVRDQLERARTQESQAFLRLAGSVDGPSDLSNRKGFSGSAKIRRESVSRGSSKP